MCDQLVTGVTRFNEPNGASLPPAFFTRHTLIEMPDGVAAFWDRLEKQRKRVA